MRIQQEFRTDPELWQALKKGDNQAVALLMKKYYRDLLNYGRKISKDEALAEDCIQELFVELWQKRDKLSDVQAVKPYLFKSLRRRLVKAHPSHPLTDIDSLPEYETEVSFSYEEFLIHEQSTLERKTKLIQALNSLTPRQREVIYLKFYEDLSYEQIAEVMSLTVPTLYDLLSKAVKRLKAFFSGVTILLLICMKLIQ
jgi:RNA polymerase sigma factor (sigma-70 family)